MTKHIPYGIHVESMEHFHSIWIPHGFHMECGGVVKYWSSSAGDTNPTFNSATSTKPVHPFFCMS